MIQRRTPLVALLAVLWMALNPAASWTASQTTFTEKVEVNLVDLNVVVTTYWGDLVTDLTRDDFEIWEDGEPRRISHFVRVIDGVANDGRLTLPMTSRPAGAKTGEQPSNAFDRSIILAFDAGVHRPYLRRAVKAARDFVAERSDDGIWWSVVMLARKPHSLLPLTNDARQVVATLESILAQNKAGRGFHLPTPAVPRTAHLDGHWSRLVLTEQSLTYPYAARNLSEIFRAYASVPGSKACVIYQQGRGGTFAIEPSARRSCLFPCRPLVQLRPAAAKEAEISVPLSLQLPAGAYTVTVALFDPVSGLSGSASEDVTVRVRAAPIEQTSAGSGSPSPVTGTRT